MRRRTEGISGPAVDGLGQVYPETRGEPNAPIVGCPNVASSPVFRASVPRSRVPRLHARAPLSHSAHRLHTAAPIPNPRARA